MYKFFVFALPLVLLLLSVEAFAPTKGPAAPSSTKLMAGFGGGAASKSKKGKKETYIKLKPKQQWDRYLDMKTEEKVNVAVRMKEDGEWLEVGRVKSKDNENIPLAVALQRAIIAEVSTPHGYS